MAIPKQIFQTYKTGDLHWVVRMAISRIKRRNPGYEHHFYDDGMILRFLEEEYPPEYLHAYKKLTIGAAKADFFRYAVLYKKGGVYLDIDSFIKTPLDKFLRGDDVAVITREGNPRFYVQWALIFDKGHPFLKKTLEMMLDNIETHRYPRDVHSTTGPGVFTDAVEACIAENPAVPYRILGVDYEGNMQFKYRPGKIFKYEKKSAHWREKQKTQDIIDSNLKR